MRAILLIASCLFNILGYAQQNSIPNLLLRIQDAVFTVYAELDDGISQGSGFFISTNGIGK